MYMRLTVIDRAIESWYGRWSDSPLDVDFVDFSAKTGAGMDALGKWLAEL